MPNASCVFSSTVNTILSSLRIKEDKLKISSLVDLTRLGNLLVKFLPRARSFYRTYQIINNAMDVHAFSQRCN